MVLIPVVEARVIEQLTARPRLLVAGARASGDGYPNAESTIRILKRHDIADIVDLGRPLPSSLHLWRIREQGLVRRVRTLLHLCLTNLRSVLGVLLAGTRAGRWVYVPYPSIPFLTLLRFVPGPWRPRCIADGYLSLWDSAFNDRGARDSSGWTSRLTRAIECRALRIADKVLVDTEDNRRFFIEHFGLAPSSVESMPLAIEAAQFLESRPKSTDGTHIQVLFVGTLIPLHGVEVILRAAELLRDRRGIEFKLIGDGQLGQLVSKAMEAGRLPNLTWVRDWLPLDQIAAQIADADICLGVFGGKGKAARVLPFKLYYYLAAGKPIISQREMSAPYGAPAPPIIAIGGGDGSALAESIERLVADASLRTKLACSAREYFDCYLSEATIATHWRRLLC